MGNGECIPNLVTIYNPNRFSVNIPTYRIVGGNDCSKYTAILKAKSVITLHANDETLKTVALYNLSCPNCKKNDPGNIPDKPEIEIPTYSAKYVRYILTLEDLIRGRFILPNIVKVSSTELKYILLHPENGIIQTYGRDFTAELESPENEAESRIIIIFDSAVANGPTMGIKSSLNANTGIQIWFNCYKCK